MLVNKRFKNLVQKTESLNDKLVLHLRKSWLDCPIKCAALDEMLEDEREFKRVHIVGSQDRFYSMDYEAFISKSVVSVVLSNAVASLSELKKFFNQLPEVQLVKFVENKVLNLEELDPSEDDEDEYEDYDEDEDDEEYIEHHIRAKVPEIINWPYPVFNKLKKFIILSGTNWGGMEDQSQLFKHARNVENIATDARDLNVSLKALLN